MRKSLNTGLKVLRIGAIILYILILIKYMPMFSYAGAGPAFAFAMVVVFGLLMRGLVCIITAKSRLRQIKESEGKDKMSTQGWKIMLWVGISLLVILVIGILYLSLGGSIGQPTTEFTYN